MITITLELADCKTGKTVYHTSHDETGAIPFWAWADMKATNYRILSEIHNAEFKNNTSLVYVDHRTKREN